MISKSLRPHIIGGIDRAPLSGWLRMQQLPIGATLARKLIAAGELLSCVVTQPGGKRGVRLVSQQSLDRYLRGLSRKQTCESGKERSLKHAGPISDDLAGVAHNDEIREN